MTECNRDILCHFINDYELCDWLFNLLIGYNCYVIKFDKKNWNFAIRTWAQNRKDANCWGLRLLRLTKPIWNLRRSKKINNKVHGNFVQIDCNSSLNQPYLIIKLDLENIMDWATGYN